MPALASTAALPLPAKGEVQVWLMERAELHNLQARALVRDVLARYCHCDPVELQFMRDAHGKPHLLTQDARLASLRFNLSHTDGCCVLAVTTDGEVGVDVESQTREANMLALAERFFSPQEIEQLRALSSDALRPGFFRLWTLKEAYVKARGLGLKLGLSTFAFDLADEPHLLSGDDSSRWSFLAFTHAGHFHIAVAVNAPDRKFVVNKST